MRYLCLEPFKTDEFFENNCYCLTFLHFSIYQKHTHQTQTKDQTKFLNSKILKKMFNKIMSLNPGIST